MNPLDRLDAHLGARYSDDTRRAWRGHARRFLLYAGPPKPVYTRAQLLNYVDKLLRDGQKGSSIVTTLTALKGLFRENDWPWPLERRDLRLGLPDEDPQTPTLSRDEVQKLIAGVKGERGLAPAVICLASVYGLRGDEIARVLAAGCDGEALEIQTAKGGRLRHHLIPEVIERYLCFRATSVSTRYLHSLFEQAMAAHVRPQAPREGLHSIRRALVTELFTNGVEEAVILKWMGWKMGHSIALHYFRPKAAVIDKQIFDRHPFLAAWR